MKYLSILFATALLFFTNFLFAQVTEDQTTYTQREFSIKTSPSDAEIYSIGATGDATKVGAGTWAVALDKDNILKVEVRKEGYQNKQRTYARQKGGVDNDVIALEVDEAYSQSEESSVVNVNINVPVNSNFTPTEAWKTIVSIIESYFDEIQTQDPTTSYLRTSWVPSSIFNKTSSNPRLIRTQIVLSAANINPLKYNVKIKSEISRNDKECTSSSTKVPTVNRDECFEPFPRILRKYDDMINEIQRRMK